MVGMAVVGAGNWGKNLVRAFASAKGASLRCVCDTSEKVLKAMAAAYPGARVTRDLAQVLGDPVVDAVVVAVDAPRHYALAKAALEAGKHTYVEKPLTLKASEAQELAALAAAKGKKLMVGHLLEYHPAVTYMKKMIDGGQVGRSLYLYFQRLNLGVVRNCENAWWSLAPHDVSVACYLFGQEPVSVSASGQAYLQKEVEDVVFASLRFADGRMAHIHVSWLDPHKIRKVTLVGSQKMVVFDDMEAAEKVRVYDKGAVVKVGVESYAEAITLRGGDILIPDIGSEEPLKIECQHFVDCIAQDTAPRSDGRDGIRVVKVLEAGSRSLANNGSPVDLE
jgi:predicted dehydrogenase